ncbi:MAG TPA: DUF302 domain-containing protein [Campylobacteraceae bacterium]|nr:DUF302 domain-containing protein [Campylobacteraceae bacterium]
MKIIKLMAVLLIAVASLHASADIIVYTADNSKGKITPKVIEEALKKSGYVVPVNRDMNGPFMKQFQKSSFETYNLLIAYHKKISMDLVLKNADSGVFVPFSMGIWQKKGDKSFSVAFLSADAMRRIVTRKGDGTEALFAKLEAATRKAVEHALPGAKEIKLPGERAKVDHPLLTKILVENDPEEAEDNFDEIKMTIETGLKPIGFILANQVEYGMELDEAGNEDFLFYDTFSLCKLKVIYNIAAEHPEAGAFAPCTLAMYQKKGSDHTVLVFPNVYNWIATLNLKKKELKALLLKAQSDMEALLNSLNE